MPDLPEVPDRKTSDAPDVDAPPDHWRRLGVPRDACDNDIQRAFRRLAAALHPDRNPGNDEAHRRFLLVTEAHDVLTHQGQMRAYMDQVRAAEPFRYAAPFARTPKPKPDGPDFSGVAKPGERSEPYPKADGKSRAYSDAAAAMKAAFERAGAKHAEAAGGKGRPAGGAAAPPAPARAPPTFKVGDEVQAHSLQGARQLNGLNGTVEGKEGDRYKIQFGVPHGVKSLKPVNLRISPQSGFSFAGNRNKKPTVVKGSICIRCKAAFSVLTDKDGSCPLGGAGGHGGPVPGRRHSTGVVMGGRPTR